MSNKIDWSKAPADATHYVPAPNDLHHPIWLKIDGNTVLNAGYIGHSHWAHSYTPGSQPCTDLSNAIQRPTTPSWSGEGLPPVGVVCEVKLQEEWSLCEIIAHFQQPQAMVAAFTVAQFHGGKKLDSKIAECFRPIRTPEQIAADEREAAISALVEEMKAKRYALEDTDVSPSEIARHYAQALYDAGYRKP